MRPRFRLALALAFASTAAVAQTHTDRNGTIISGVAPLPNIGGGAYVSATIGTSDSTILGAASAYYILDIINDSPSATICVNFGATATISGTACAAGEITLPPLWHRSWEGSFIPSDAVHAIASSASTPVSLGAK